MKKVLSAYLALSLIFTNISPAFATETSTAPDAANIVITNNVSKADTVKVTGLQASDVIKVYREATATTPFASATVASTASQATAYITQLSQQAGNVYVSVKSYGKLESEKVPVNYDAEVQTTSPDASNITVTNNYIGRADSVKIVNVQAGDIVKVYKDSSSIYYWGTTTVASGNTEAVLNISQLGKLSGSVYVTVKKINELESNRTQVDFAPEPVSDSLDANNITIKNNVGMADTIKVTGLVAGDILRVYRDISTTTALGGSTVPLDKTEGIINVSQLGTTGGNVYVTVKKADKHESLRVPKSYDAEVQTTSPDASNITVTNNYIGKADSVKIVNVQAGDIVKVYMDSSSIYYWGAITVASGNTEAVLNISQLGKLSGSVYVTVKKINELESKRTTVNFAAEPVSDSLDANNITIKNNAGLADTIKVTGLVAGDILRVYRDISITTALGSYTVPLGKTEGIINVSQLGITGGNVYITVKKADKHESLPVPKSYDAEVQTLSPDVSSITVTNNLMIDTISVAGITAGDTVKVYKDSNCTILLGSAVVPTGTTTATVKVAQLGQGAGSVYVTLKSPGKYESTKIQADYIAEPKNDVPDLGTIIVKNNAGIPDTVKVTGLIAGDIIRVYRDNVTSTALGYAIVASGKTEAEIKISQLGLGSGSIYVTVKSTNKLESNRQKVDYAAEAKTANPDLANIIITNNATGIVDTVKFTSLAAGDIVKVYKDATTTSALGIVTVAVGKTEAIVNINQLGIGAGSVYVTVKTLGQYESNRVQVDFLEEPKSIAPDIANITINNKFTGITDTIVVSGLAEGDIVKVFKDATTLLGIGKVALGSNQVTINIDQLGQEAGTVFLTVTSVNKNESDPVQVAYIAEPKTDSPDSANITVTNYAGVKDRIKVTGVNPGDIVKVYRDGSTDTVLALATVRTGTNEVTLFVTQLGTGTGSVYVTVKTADKLESNRVKADYTAETKSATPDLSTITITNNAGLPDTIKVTGLSQGDMIKVYADAVTLTPLWTATVGASATEATISIPQLGTSNGTVFVSVVIYGQYQSDRVQADYLAEAKTPSPDIANITVTNNTGTNDTVRVTGINEGDIVRVYSDSLTLLASATVAPAGTEVTVDIAQLGVTSGTVYVTVETKAKTESDRVSVDYLAEL